MSYVRLDFDRESYQYILQESEYIFLQNILDGGGVIEKEMEMEMEMMKNVFAFVEFVQNIRRALIQTLGRIDLGAREDIRASRLIL